MLKNALLLAAIALSLPAHAAQPTNVIFDWKLFHNGELVDGQPPITRLLNGSPYPHRDLSTRRYNKSTVHDGNKVKTVAGYINTGVELTLKSSWQDGVESATVICSVLRRALRRNVNCRSSTVRV